MYIGSTCSCGSAPAGAGPPVLAYRVLLGKDDGADEGFLTARSTDLRELHPHVARSGHPREVTPAAHDVPVARLDPVVHLVGSRPEADLQDVCAAGQHV